jgi:hypothetical protein
MGPDKNKFRIKRDIFVTWEISESEAFCTLSGTAIRVLLRFLQKRTWSKMKHKGKKTIIYNNSGLSFTYTEAKALGISTSAFYRTLTKLISVGFIDIEHQGGPYGRDYSRYKISERWQDYGTDKFVNVEKARIVPIGWDIQSWRQRKDIKSSTFNSDSCKLSTLKVSGKR